jgi:GT2 family glycosyltransferase
MKELWAHRRGQGKEPVVSVVVLNWCGEQYTADCIRSLQRSAYSALRILLVDNGSPDGSGERLRHAFSEVDYLQTGSNLGYAGGNNRGIERALADGAEYVLILNNDTVADPHCVSWLVRMAESNTRIGAVSPKILYHEDPDRVWFAGGDFSRLRALSRHRGEGGQDRGDRKPGDVSFLTGCCLLVRSSVLQTIGGFDESFFAYLEDVDLSLRLLDAGYRLVYEPRARLLHRVPLRNEPSPFQILQRDRNRRRLVRKRYGALHRAVFALFFYPSRIVRLAGYLLRRDPSRARAVWNGMTAAMDRGEAPCVDHRDRSRMQGAEDGRA